ncbi:MAG: hypothetical protein KGL95_02600, partial [Patescibacteria group bacterium]|nr:hypothetical protein [Patescibacteria group bacterium]
MTAPIPTALAMSEQARSGNTAQTGGVSNSNQLYLSNVGGLGIQTSLIGNGALVVNQPNLAGDIFTASSSSTPKFTITNSGAIGLGAWSSTFTGTSGQCLISGGNASTPSWSTCQTGNNILWNQLSGALTPAYSTNDLLIGGTSTSSAKFAVLNVSSGTPTATVAGNFIVMPWTNGTSEIGGNVGIGTAIPGQSLHVYSTTNASNGIRIENTNINSSAYAQLELKNSVKQFNVGLGSGSTALFPNSFFVYDVNANVARFIISQTGNAGVGPLSVTEIGNAQFVINQKNAAGSGDIFSASTSGAPKFTITNSGAIGLGAYSATYTGLNGQCLMSQGSGSTPSWSNCGNTFWNESLGALSPIHATVDDLLIGGSSTSSAKFAVLNINSGIPTASFSA